ncbi:MAG: phytanoyl-CoA dioxygenase family protein [Kiloniellales bacterium]
MSDLKRRYLEEGYVVIPDLVPRKAIRDILDEMTQVFLARRLGRFPGTEELAAADLDALLAESFVEDFAGYHGAAKLTNHLISLHRLSVAPAVVDTLRILGLAFPAICARPLVWFHAPHLARTERYHRLPAHQEWSNMQGSLDGCVVWLPLVPIEPEMGRLQVIPRSHAWDLLPFAKDEAKDYPLSIDPAQIDDEEFVEVDVPAGSALFFSSFLVHRSGTNGTSKARLTANFRFNNAAEPSFIAREYLNPFHYAVAEGLKHPGFPQPGAVARLLGERLPLAAE